eukprot:3142605-Rhodomonas_salina.2
MTDSDRHQGASRHDPRSPLPRAQHRSRCNPSPVQPPLSTARPTLTVDGVIRATEVPDLSQVFRRACQHLPGRLRCLPSPRNPPQDSQCPCKLYKNGGLCAMSGTDTADRCPLRTREKMVPTMGRRKKGEERKSRRRRVRAGDQEIQAFCA